MIGAGIAPVAQRAGANQDDVTGLDVNFLRGKRSLEFLRSDGEVGGKSLDSFPGTDINHYAARNHRRYRVGVGLADAEVAAVVLLAKPVVPVIVGPGGDVSKPVDLGPNIVGDEQRAAMKGNLLFALGKRLNIFSPLHTLRAAIGHYLGGRMPGPLVRRLVDTDPKIINLTGLHRTQGAQHRCGTLDRIERSHFVRFTPGPAPALSLHPALRGLG